jgi:adenosylcobinamide kinase / adenosylcobinamide-phosphate guanylyltransferase
MEGRMGRELKFILGGARSGKSTHAQDLAEQLGGDDGVLFVATAQAYDDDMRARIVAHQASRPAGWATLEAPLHVGEQIANALAERAGVRVVLVDCLTLLVSNALLAGDADTGGADGSGADADPRQAERVALVEIEGLLDAYAASDATWVIVSNEVGLGVVPAYSLGRAYRDALGRANQRMAAAADRVLFMVAGIPMRVKG